MAIPPRRLPQLSALRVFEVAARHQNLLRAAEELNVTHGAVSKQVQALARIIHRTARNRPRPPNTWARDFIAKNSIKQPIRIVVNDIKGLALTVHFS